MASPSYTFLRQGLTHVVQAALEFAGQLRMTVDFWSSCHQLLSVTLLVCATMHAYMVKGV